jgi:hypothetical protein
MNVPPLAPVLQAPSSNTFTVEADFVISDKAFDHSTPVAFGDKVTLIHRFPQSGELAMGMLEDTKTVIFVMGESWPLIAHSLDYWNSPTVLREFHKMSIMGVAVRRI